MNKTKIDLVKSLINVDQKDISYYCDNTKVFHNSGSSAIFFDDANELMYHIYMQSSGTVNTPCIEATEYVNVQYLMAKLTKEQLKVVISKPEIRSQLSDYDYARMVSVFRIDLTQAEEDALYEALTDAQKLELRKWFKK